MGKVADYLLMELESVYCGTCAYGEDYSQCDECDRKRMGWELSIKKAEQMEKKIYELLEVK